MKYIQTGLYSANDWHDWNIETNTYFDKTRCEMVQEYLSSINIPSDFTLDMNRVMNALMGNEGYQFSTIKGTTVLPDGEKIEHINGTIVISKNKISFTSEPRYGAYHTEWCIAENEIEDNDLCFLIVEEFHVFPKIAPSTMHFYESPVRTLEEAKEKLDSFVSRKADDAYGEGLIPPTAFIMPYSMKKYEEEKENPDTFVGYNVAKFEKEMQEEQER